LIETPNPIRRRTTAVSNRFFLDEPVTADRATLAGSEAHHLLHVLRARVGDEVVLIDGSGQEFLARIDRLGRSQIELAIISATAVDRELGFELAVGVAWPKAERQRWLIEKLVELGATRVIPLRTERSVVHPDQASHGKHFRAVMEACKQCGRNRPMEIGPLTPWPEFARMAGPAAVKWLADPSGTPLTLRRQKADGCHVAIGPEGGWTAAELEQGREAGWHIVSLGSRILRIETAAVAIVALLAYGDPVSDSSVPHIDLQ
jgi:16S rRNA (uracil1498-N3)-methyltransferase